jgi:hypothetical protein
MGSWSGVLMPVSRSAVGTSSKGDCMTPGVGGAVLSVQNAARRSKISSLASAKILCAATSRSKVESLRKNEQVKCPAGEAAVTEKKENKEQSTGRGEGSPVG